MIVDRENIDQRTTAQKRKLRSNKNGDVDDV